MKELKAEDFLVDFGFDEQAMVHAEYVGILDGCLCFLDGDDRVIEFYGQGHWKRVRIKEGY